MLKVPKEMLVMKKEDVLAVVTSKEINVMNVIQNTMVSQLVTVCFKVKIFQKVVWIQSHQLHLLVKIQIMGGKV